MIVFRVENSPAFRKPIQSPGDARFPGIKRLPELRGYPPVRGFLNLQDNPSGQDVPGDLNIFSQVSRTTLMNNKMKTSI